MANAYNGANALPPHDVNPVNGIFAAAQARVVPGQQPIFNAMDRDNMVAQLQARMARPAAPFRPIRWRNQM